MDAWMDGWQLRTFVFALSFALPLAQKFCNDCIHDNSSVVGAVVSTLFYRGVCLYARCCDEKYFVVVCKWHHWGIIGRIVADIDTTTSCAPTYLSL